MKRRLFTLTAAAALAAATSISFAQTKWDLPTAYPATNFHTENITQFAKDVDAATGGKLKIAVHPNASLFKAPEIKRAVQSSQAQAGEILLANFANENPLYALDGVPFLASSYPDARKLYDVSKPAMEKLLAAQGMKLLFSVPWAPQGIFTKKEQPGHGQDCRADRCPARADPAGRAECCHGYRCDRVVHEFGLHRLRHQDV